MPQLESWENLPEGVRQHLIERMRDRAISVSDLILKEPKSLYQSPSATL